MKHLLTYFFFALASLLPLSAQPQPGVDVQHYVFRLTLSDSTDRIAAQTEVTAQFTEPGVKELRLDLIGKGQKPAGTGMTVSEVLGNGKKLPFTHSENALRIPLAAAPVRGEKQTFTIIYSGIPADGLVISKNKFGSRTFFGDNWPNRARHWLPTVDHPSDKATLEFVVTAPVHYQVVANGLLREETDLLNGQRLTHWVEAVPIPTKVMVIGASRFAVQYVDTIRNISVQSWVYPQDRNAGFIDYAPAVRILEFMASLIGPYPYGKLANVQSKTRFGGMENAGNIFYNEDAIHGKPNPDMERLIAHEIAHQWFGNSVTERDWPHVWLSEGFASYMAYVYMGHAYGLSQLTKHLAEQRKKVFDYARKAPDDPVVVSRPRDLMGLLNANSYEKGAWTLHMLRSQTGDEAFWQGIRNYYSRYRNGNAATEDFQKVMEEASGKDLSGFFRQWLYTPGHPRLTGTWSYDEKAKEVVIGLRQESSGAAFSFPLEIGLYDAAGKRLRKETVQIDGKEKTFRIKTQSAPARITPDPDVKLLAEVELRRR